MSFEFVPGFDVKGYFDFSRYVKEKTRKRSLWKCRMCGKEILRVSQDGHLRWAYPEVFRESTAKEAFP